MNIVRSFAPLLLFLFTSVTFSSNEKILSCQTVMEKFNIDNTSTQKFLKKTVLALTEPNSYEHAYLGLGWDINRRPSPTEWLEFIFSFEDSRKNFQSNWPETSLEGQIWTNLKDSVYGYKDRGYIIISFTLKPNYRFFFRENRDSRVAVSEAALEAGVSDLWKIWFPKNGQKKNRFSKKHIEKLKEAKLPFHSAFYDDFKLVGVGIPMRFPIDLLKLGVDAYTIGSTTKEHIQWNIINFNAISELTIKIPENIKLPYGIDSRNTIVILKDKK